MIALTEKSSVGIEIAKDLVKDGKINPEALEWITDEAMCETFGWLPDELNTLSIDDYDMFSLIVSFREGLRAEKLEEMKRSAP